MLINLHKNEFVLNLFHSRVIKSAGEIEVLRYVAKVSSDAHKVVMRTVKYV